VNAPRLELRPARIADVPALARIYQRTRTTCLPYLPVLHDEAEHREWLARRARGDGELWVAARGAPIGFAAVRDDWLDHLYVEPEAQGAGAGTALLGLAMRSQDFLQLWVFQKNVRAIRFYESHEFRLVKRTDGSANEEREPDALYAWRASVQRGRDASAIATTNAGARPSSISPSIERT